MTLPKGWACARIDDLVLPDGLFCDGDWVETKDQDPAGNVRLVQLADIGEGVFRDRSRRFLTEEKAVELRGTLLRKGDILVARMPDPLGRACIFPGDAKPCITVVDVCIVRPAAVVEPRWLMWWLNAPQLRRSMLALQAGTTRKRISRRNLGTIEFPVPPLAEQRRIVAAVEEQFSRLDAAEAALLRARLLSNRLRRAILVFALRGPWPVARLDEIAEVRLGRQRSPKNHSGPHMRPYLRAANVTWAGLDLSDVKEMNFTPEEVLVYRLAPGDILLAEASGSASGVGKPAIWRNEIDACCFQNTLLRVRSRGPLPEYLLLVFREAALTGRFGAAAGGVGIHHLGAAQLSAWPIPVPSIDEQERIVQEVERQLSLIEALERQVGVALLRESALRRAILDQAFTGKLVPQDPSDEPSSALLERIAAEQAARPASRRRKARA